jgi:hypothetical protein
MLDGLIRASGVATSFASVVSVRRVVAWGRWAFQRSSSAPAAPCSFSTYPRSTVCAPPERTMCRVHFLALSRGGSWGGACRSPRGEPRLERGGVEDDDVGKGVVPGGEALPKRDALRVRQRPPEPALEQPGEDGELALFAALFATFLTALLEQVGVVLLSPCTEFASAPMTSSSS